MYLKLTIKLIALCSICFSQVSIESIPKSFLMQESLSHNIEELPSFDINSFLEEDENDLRTNIRKPYRFANPIPVNFNMNNSGNWITLDDGSSIWTLQINSPNAYSLNII